jgi:hypothetical protein
VQTEVARPLSERFDVSLLIAHVVELHAANLALHVAGTISARCVFCRRQARRIWLTSRVLAQDLAGCIAYDLHDLKNALTACEIGCLGASDHACQFAVMFPDMLGDAGVNARFTLSRAAARRLFLTSTSRRFLLHTLGQHFLGSPAAIGCALAALPPPAAAEANEHATKDVMFPPH